MSKIMCRGGQTAAKGTYWDFYSGDRVTLQSSGLLPGGQNVIYFKLPPWAVLMGGPVIGLMFAVFLPLVGIVMIAGILGRKVLGGFFERLQMSAAFSWRPSEAYFSGRSRKSRRHG